ncbi:MAG TPA: RagB/SusD family nutrient uptake outer membrane protein, partial [Sphingobacteriaceae bacterium]
MKRYIYVLLTLLAPLSGCKKFLATEPTDFLSPVTYYENEEQLKFAIAGVYDILGQNAVYGTRLISRMNMEADEGYYVTATVTTGTQANDYTASDPDIENLWAALYNGINRANVVLENVDKNTSISQAYRDQV